MGCGETNPSTAAEKTAAAFQDSSFGAWGESGILEVAGDLFDLRPDAEQIFAADLANVFFAQPAPQKLFDQIRKGRDVFEAGREGGLQLTISIGVPQRDACVAACLLRSWGLRWTTTKLPAFTTTALAPW